MKTSRVVLIVAALAVFALGLATQAGRVLLFGWVGYLRRVVPEVSVNWSGVLMFVVSLTVFGFLIHYLARWCRAERGATPWRASATLRVTAVIALMFGCGTAMVGVVHQTIWLATDDEDFHVPVWNREPGSRWQLSDIANGVDQSEEAFDSVTAPSDWQRQSWITRIMMFAGQTYTVDDLVTDKPWDHPDNQKFFRKINPSVLNPELKPAVFRDRAGYGVSHYAGNVHVFRGPATLRLADIPNGAASTFLVGEINTGFAPWGKPNANLRDPADGINTRRGFGGAIGTGGANFAMADGSVRFFSAKTDRRLMRALATPNGGEEVK